MNRDWIKINTTEEWIPLNPPKPDIGKRYDIVLNDGVVVNDVWYAKEGFGLPDVAHSDMIKIIYPISTVSKFRGAAPKRHW